MKEPFEQIQKVIINPSQELSLEWNLNNFYKINYKISYKINYNIHLQKYDL